VPRMSMIMITFPANKTGWWRFSGADGPRARPQSAPRKSRIAPVYCRLRFRLQSAAQPGDYSRLLRRPRAANRSAETSQRIAVKLMYPNHGKTGTVVLSATEGKTHADA